MESRLALTVSSAQRTIRGQNLDLIVMHGTRQELVAVLDATEADLIARNAKHKRYDDGYMAAIENNEHFTWTIEDIAQEEGA